MLDLLMQYPVDGQVLEIVMVKPGQPLSLGDNVVVLRQGANLNHTLS